MLIPVKTVTHPITGQTFKLGRRRPTARPNLKLGNYLSLAALPLLPVAPPMVDYMGKALALLKQDFGSMGLGNCTASAAFRATGIMLANVGQPFTGTKADAIKLYSATTKYVSGNEDTDQGADEQTVLNHWKATGLIPGQHKIAGWATVDATNPEEIKSAIYLFENLYFGVELPDAWIDPPPSADGFKWDVAGEPSPLNGHAFVGVGYDAKSVAIATWGMIGAITYPAIEKYCSLGLGGELYTVFGADAIDKATEKAPNGLDGPTLLSDLNNL